MKKCIAVLLSLALMAGVAGCGTPPVSSTAGSGAGTASQPQPEQAPQELIQVRAAYHPNLGPMTIPGIDMLTGAFAEEGLEVEWLKFTAGAPEIAAMVSGDLQFGYIGHGALALCAEGEAEVLSLSHYTNSEALMVRASSGIETMEDLVGKTIGTEVGTSADVLLEMACTKYGIDPDSITVVNMPMANAISAFIGGSIDAVVAWGADIASIVKNVDEEVNTIVQTSDFLDVVPFIGSWIANGDYVAQNEDVVLRFIRGLNRCYEYRYNNLDETIQAAADFAVAADIGVSYEELVSERDQLVFFPIGDMELWLQNGKLENDFQLQLEYMISSGRVDEGDIYAYVRFDLMREALQ